MTKGPCGYSMNHVSVSSTSSRVEKVCRRSVRWRISPALWGPRSSRTVSTARSLGCKILYTEDLNAGQDYGGVVARNPFASA